MHTMRGARVWDARATRTQVLTGGEPVERHAAEACGSAVEQQDMHEESGPLTSTGREEGDRRPRILRPTARGAVQHLAHGRKQRRNTQALRSHFRICLL